MPTDDGRGSARYHGIHKLSSVIDAVRSRRRGKFAMAKHRHNPFGSMIAASVGFGLARGVPFARYVDVAQKTVAAGTALLLLALLPIMANAATVETIVMVRHGEKPALGLGQLNCQGLNRSLALPKVIEAKFGKPDLIIAPDPAQQKKDVGISYDYVRPLATIEPTAIYFGMPISSSLGFDQADALGTLLLSEQNHKRLVVVAGEHRVIEAVARRLVTQMGGSADAVPHWRSRDFDSMYIVQIRRGDGPDHVDFRVDHEGLDDRSSVCPVG